MSVKDLEAFGEKPTRDSIQDYRFVRLWVGGVYAVLILCLLSFGSYETYSALTQPASTVDPSTALVVAGKPPAAVPPVVH